MTRSRDTADTQDNNGGSVSPFVAGKNKILNGDFGIWQRGTTFNSIASGAFMADRWYQVQTGTMTINASQQTFTPGSAPVAGYEGKTFLRIARTAHSSGSLYIATKVEDVQTLAGQTVTLSYWARVASGTLTPNRVYVAQNFGTGGSAEVDNIGNASPTYTTTWTRYTQTFTIPSIAGKTVGPNSFLYGTIWEIAASPTTFTLDIWGVQLEAGSVATPFTTATGTIQGELAACQRYYWRAASGDGNTVFGSGWGWTGTTATLILYPKVTLRTKPTSVDFSGVVLQALPGGTTYAITSWPVDTGLIGFDAIATLPAVASGLTAGTNYRIFGSSSASYVGLSAEL